MMQSGTHTIIPKPAYVAYSDGAFSITISTGIALHKNTPEMEDLCGVASYLADKLQRATGFLIPIGGDNSSIILKTIPKTLALSDGVDYALAGGEGYILDVKPDKLVLSAYTPEGLFRGVQTIRQLLPCEAVNNAPKNEFVLSIPCMTITDYPRYKHRGVMLDVSRKFFRKEEVMRQIELLSQYKINVMHLHLSDDQGFRVAFDGYPELREFGGMIKCLYIDKYNTDNVVGTQSRLSPGSMYSGEAPGFYTKDDFLEILRYADERFVTVIPELEFPSHCYAQLLSLPLLNESGELPQCALTYDGVGKNNAFWSDMVGQCVSANPEGTSECAKYTKAFIEDVFTQLAGMLYGRHKYIHIGGDEAANQDFDGFVAVTRLAIDTIRSKGIIPIQWSMVTAEKPGHYYADIFQDWSSGGETSRLALESGANVIASLAQTTYLDQSSSESMPVGHYWASKSGINADGMFNWDPEESVPCSYRNKGRVIGIEGCVWSETCGTPEALDILMYPRVISLAEVAWSPARKRSGTEEGSEWNDDFRPRLSAHGERLSYQGVTFMNEAVVWPEITMPCVTPDNVTFANPIQIQLNSQANGRFHFPETAIHGGKLSVRLVGRPAQGNVELSTDGGWTYTPVRGFIGKDSFSVAFMLDGFGIPMGPPMALISDDRGRAQWNAFRNVNIEVINPSSAAVSCRVSLTANRPTNVSLSFDAPVPGLLADNFTIPGAKIRMAESFDNGATYLLVTSPRNDGGDYVVSVKKEGYRFNDVALITRRLTKKPVRFEGESASFIVKPYAKLIVEAAAFADLDAVKEAAESLAGIMRLSTGFALPTVACREGGIRDFFIATIPKSSELTPGVDYKTAGECGFSLNIGVDGVFLRAYDPKGLYCGIKAIVQLLPPEIECAAPVRGVDWVMTYARVLDY